jgi:hypothetical protein
MRVARSDGSLMPHALQASTPIEALAGVVERVTFHIRGLSRPGNFRPDRERRLWLASEH